MTEPFKSSAFNGAIEKSDIQMKTFCKETARAVSGTPRERLARDLCAADGKNPDKRVEGWDSEGATFKNGPLWHGYVRKADKLLAAGLAYRTDVMEEAARELCWHCRDGHPLNERGKHSISSRSDVPCLAAALRAKAKEPA